ncbi:uncharacterized protein LOC116415746 [Nasonia vitripennis]|uniref:Uncharacterized protein n=1 Tax=Nasonia vitripennis TaxID=7425 RepID=A0A7M7PVE4_NASVI|nr:uncharacterized protein LOC116415746 [Nasonia vitripennis]
MFIDEINNLYADGLSYMSEIFTVDIDAFVLDVLVKSLSLRTKGHAGYYSCPTCQVVGSRIGNVTCFPNGTDQELRTDEDFRNLSYLGTYQLGQTILNRIPGIGLVTGVPRDCMHLVCLGITRKLLFLWKYGPSNIKVNVEQINIISDGLQESATFLPTDFSRRLRSLQFVKQWKATECRRFILYDGIILVKDALSKEQYDNFVKLHVGIRLLTMPAMASNPDCVNLAESLLKDFVQSFEVIYGGRYVSYNVDNLLHLASDVRLYGCLDNFSAFRFESFIFFYKKLLRKHNHS